MRKMPLKGWEAGYAQGVADTMAKIKDSRAAGYRAGVSDTLAAMGRKHGMRALGGKRYRPQGVLSAPASAQASRIAV